VLFEASTTSGSNVPGRKRTSCMLRAILFSNEEKKNKLIQWWSVIKQKLFCNSFHARTHKIFFLLTQKEITRTHRKSILYESVIANCVNFILQMLRAKRACVYFERTHTKCVCVCAVSFPLFVSLPLKVIRDTTKVYSHWKYSEQANKTKKKKKHK
jgi:hypothetical protein